LVEASGGGSCEVILRVVISTVSQATVDAVGCWMDTLRKTGVRTAC
jgi:hypothetical protein